MCLSMESLMSWPTNLPQYFISAKIFVLIRSTTLPWGHLLPPQLVTTNHLDLQITPLWALQVVHPQAHQVALLRVHQAARLWAHQVAHLQDLWVGPLMSPLGLQAHLEADQIIHPAPQVHLVHLAPQPAISETLRAHPTPIMFSSSQILHKVMAILMRPSLTNLWARIPANLGLSL